MVLLHQLQMNSDKTRQTINDTTCLVRKTYQIIGPLLELIEYYAKEKDDLLVTVKG